VAQRRRQEEKLCWLRVLCMQGSGCIWCLWHELWVLTASLEVLPAHHRRGAGGLKAPFLHPAVTVLAFGAQQVCFTCMCLPA
jgi:hypothetical protein